MKALLLLASLMLPSCVAARGATAAAPDMAVAYRDLALETPGGRAVLAARVARATAAFCAAYDPHNPNAIFDARLASRRHCTGAAALMLAHRMPAPVRKAYRRGQRGQ